MSSLYPTLSLDLTPRQLCDIEMLLTGAFDPLTGFLNQADYDSVVKEMRLTTGELWPMPVTLDVSRSFVEKLVDTDKIALRDLEGVVLAILHIESTWEPNKELEAQSVFGTTDDKHPAVNYLFNQAGDCYLGGRLEKVELPQHYDYRQHRHTPAELKAHFKKFRLETNCSFSNA